jgi:methylmalonyl-CoA mutase
VRKEKLCIEFPPVSTKQWEEAINKELKGADYEKKLVWKTSEGIKIKPYYRFEDTEKLCYLNVNPGEFPYVRGNKTQGNYWEIRQDIKIYDIPQANHDALEALEQGATSIGFIVGDKIKTLDDFTRLIKGISIGCINFNLVACDNALMLLDFVINESKKNGFDPSIMDGFISFNPLGILSSTGSWLNSEEEDFKTAKSLVEKAKKGLPGYRVLAANGCIFQESGATIVQTLGYTLAIANEYLSNLTELGLSIDDVAPRIQFNFVTGSNYFFEITKIRAFRLLWSQVVEAYHPKSKEVTKAYIHSTTSKWNMTVFDPYVNMLRATTESMSAVIGGTDSLSVKPFDTAFKKTGNLSNRIARNTQIILKEEAYFDRVADPAAGSYYIENLTESIAAEAWKLFLNIQENGGYSASFKNGIIQNEIEAIAAKRLNDIATRREILLGTNQYPNFNEQALNNIDFEILEEVKNISLNPVAKPLKKFRGAKAFEELRLKTEKCGYRPKVFMLTIGSLSMSLARSQFSCNFFACVGFEVIDTDGFKTIDDGIKAALAAKADIVVLCSSDDEYATFAPEAYEKLCNKCILVIAGAPACQAELEAKGIRNFISIRSNVLETLKYYQKELKIE